MYGYSYKAVDKSYDMFYDEQMESMSSLAEFQYFQMLQHQDAVIEENARIAWENYIAEHYAMDIV